MNHGSAIHVKVHVYYHPEKEQDTCRGCVFKKAPIEECPQDSTHKLLCAEYTQGPRGIWKFHPYKEVT